MPNLRGVSPVGRDGEGHSYAASTVSRGRLIRRRHGQGKVLNSRVMTSALTGHVSKSYGLSLEGTGCGKEGAKGATRWARQARMGGRARSDQAHARDKTGGMRTGRRGGRGRVI